VKQRFKDHIVKMRRYQTSTGRDLETGLRLDRNERVMDANNSLLEKLWQSMPSSILHVTPDVGELYDRIAAYEGIDRDKIYLGQGITECIRFLYETLTEPGENVVVLDPTYPMYMVYAELFELEYRRFVYGQDHRPLMQSLYDNCDDKTAIVAIANPNLPIESALTRDELRKIAAHCQSLGAILVVDEAYHHFGAESAIPLVDEFSNIVVMRTFSKAWGMAGIRLGYMISQSQNIEYLSKTRSLVETNAFSMTAAMFALDHPELMSDHVAEVKDGAAFLRAGLDKMGVAWHGGEYTNGIMIFMSTAEEARRVVADLRAQNIYIRGAFEPPYDSCIRVSLGGVPAMERFLDAFQACRARVAAAS
jgi:histidinol-phosphate aminotransferase